MEQFDVYDDERIKLNKVLDRGTPLTGHENRLTIHICLFNEKNEMLIQLRQSTKKHWPSLWDVSVGGNSQAGENSRQTAQRELEEELGIVYDFSNTRPHITINFQNGFDDFYLLKIEDKDTSEFVIQENEVQEVKWVSKQELSNLIDEGKFIPYIKSFLLSLFDMNQQYGAVID